MGYENAMRAIDECSEHLFAAFEAIEDPTEKLRAYVRIAQNDAPEKQLRAIRFRSERAAKRMLCEVRRELRAGHTYPCSGVNAVNGVNGGLRVNGVNVVAGLLFT